MSDCWNTPRWLAEELGRFDLDPSSNPTSHIRASRAYQLERNEDGLVLPWEGSVFLNPPYSKPLPWCLRLRDHKGPWCALLKLDPTTKSWAALMEAAPTVAPFRKRLKFEGERNMTANFASVLIWRDWQCPEAVAGRLWM